MAADLEMCPYPVCRYVKGYSTRVINPHHSDNWFWTQSVAVFIMQDHKCSKLIYCSLFHLAKIYCQIELCWRKDADEYLSLISIHIHKFVCNTCVWLEILTKEERKVDYAVFNQQEIFAQIALGIYFKINKELLF